MTQEPQPPGHDPVSDATADAGVRHQPAALQTLQQAMRRARFDDAERTGVIFDLRAAHMGRLDLLREALQPLVAQIPHDVDMFDVALMPGANPRLFIDMIGFVEMGRDARLYRLVQDTRHGRTTIAEGTAIDAMVAAVTDYVARRLLERDKALAADTASQAPKRKARADEGSGARRSAMTAGPVPAQPAGTRRGVSNLAAVAFAFLIDLLGSIAFFTILAALGWIVWNRLHGPVG